MALRPIRFCSLLTALLLATLFILCPALSLLQAQSYRLLTTSIPSDVAAPSGIFVEITLPLNPRYGAFGAPVVVHVPSGWGSYGLSCNQDNKIEGCIEIRFNFPGDSTPGQSSGGVYDMRGKLSAQAVRDVVRFALGNIPDKNGKKLHDMMQFVKPMYTNVGILAWGNGGNVALAATGAWGTELDRLAWMVLWEAPIGDGMHLGETGLHGMVRNSAYDPDTGKYDYQSLAWSDAITIQAINGNGKQKLRGGWYLDIDNSNHTQKSYAVGHNDKPSFADYVFSPYLYKGKVYYSNRVRLLAAARGIVPATLPSHIPSEAENKDFWLWRNGEHWIQRTVEANKHLMFSVVAAERDHNLTALDHPHILLQYEALRTAGARFVRLNPDRVYVEDVADKKLTDVVDNDAFMPFDNISIRKALNPAGSDAVPTSTFVAAAALELADRTLTNNAYAQLHVVRTKMQDTAKTPDQDVTISPNPFAYQAIVRVRVPKHEHVKLIVFDTLGREVQSLLDDELDPGVHVITLKTENLSLSPQTYFLRLSTPTLSSTTPMYILR